MAENNTATEVAKGASPTALDSGKGLEDFGYRREGYLDRGTLDTFLNRENYLPATMPKGGPTDIQQKLADYASERIQGRTQKIEDNISNYLSNPETNTNTANIYKDLYDSYLATGPENPESRSSFIRQMTNLSSQLTPRSTTNALDNLLSDWADSPSSLLDSAKNSAISFGNDVDAAKWASSASIGDIVGWDSAAYDRAFNASGLEGFSEMSRTVKAREEAARAEAERLAAERAKRNRNSFGLSGDGGYNSLGGGGGGLSNPGYGTSAPGFGGNAGSLGRDSGEAGNGGYGR